MRPAVKTDTVRVYVGTGTPPEMKRRQPEVAPVTVRAERMGGTPTLAGTRTPVAALLDHLATGGSLPSFVKDHEELTEGDCAAALYYLRDVIEEKSIGETEQ